MVKEGIDLFDGHLSKIIQKQARPSFIPFRWFVKDEKSKFVEREIEPDQKFQLKGNSGTGFAEKLQQLEDSYEKGRLQDFWR